MRKFQRQAARAAAKRGHRDAPAPHPQSQPQRLNDEWRRWTAENLLLGAPMEPVAARLAELGAPAKLIADEIQSATASPYFHAGGTVAARLAKRDWVMDSLARLAAMAMSADVPRIDRPSPDTFLRDYYALNRPAILVGLFDHWPARTLWSLDHIATVVGDPEIEVQTGREGDADYEARSDRHKQLMPLSTLLARLRSGQASNDYYITANNGGHNRQALATLWTEIGDMPGFLVQDASRDGFFWMGPKGTITPFHHDLTNNFLVQIVGRKRVTLIPSWETHRMRNHMHCYSEWTSPADFAALPPERRPTSIVCTLAPGETLFIPVGWWHYVEGLDTTIGLSFTNFAWDNDFHTDYRSYGAM